MSFTNYSFLLAPPSVANPFPPAVIWGLGIRALLYCISKRQEWTKVHIFLWRHLEACYIMSTTVYEMSWVNVWISPEHICAFVYIGIISVLVFNVSPLLSFLDEVSPCVEWLPRKRKRGRTNPQHDWLLSPPSPLFISTTISGIFINPHGSMCLGVVKIDKWLIRIPAFYFPTD